MSENCFLTKQSLAQTTLGGNMLARWWPEQLNLSILNINSPQIRPEGENFNYSKEFEKLDLEAVKQDLRKIMTQSQPWWPADYGHYGPLFIRMAWHSAGTYRILDGRGGASSGNQRLAPVNSWPDNINLDKARRLLWPVKKKYGNKISWADLMILAGNVALESMGFKTYGFAGGRVDIYEPEIDTYWGPETQWLGNQRQDGKGNLEKPLAAFHMGLIYVNPEGPDGEPNILESAKQIRESFYRMGMNDVETVALIAGGHTFGKAHGKANPQKYLGPEPEAAPIEQQGLGWKSSYKSGKGPDTITSGLEGAWTPTPIQWDNSFLRILFKYDWNLERSPAGAWQWVAVNPDPEDMVPDPFDPSKKHKPIMLTTDLTLRYDPVYAKIAKEFLADHKKLEKEFAHAWFKLTHRDLGPKNRYLGSQIPKQDLIWQDPLPERDFELIDQDDIENLKKQILDSGLSISQLVYTAWSAASTFRASDKKGGVNGARIRLKPQIDWEVNQSPNVSQVLQVLDQIKQNFNASATGNKQVSLADLIVLAGNAAIEKAAQMAGFKISVPFTPGRVDASQEQTDVDAFKYLEPVADGFRNYIKQGCDFLPEQALIDKAKLLTLTVPEMTVLLGGLRVLGANYNNSQHGVFTEKPGQLTNDFFVNLLDMNIEWQPQDDKRQIFTGFDRQTKTQKFTATRVDLIFGANSQLRAQAEFYAQDDNKEKFVQDFVKAWAKVMDLDRFDVKWW